MHAPNARRQLLRLLSVLFAFALIAAACGDDDDTEGTGDDAASETDDGGEAADGEATDADGDGEAADADGEAADGEATDADGEAADGDGEAADGEAPPPDEERTASDVGITEDTIKIGVLVSDLDGLREAGFGAFLGAKLTTDHLADRYRTYFDNWDINGRTIETVVLTWDPLDTATMRNACTQAALDEEVFMVINASGFRPDEVPCFAADNDILFVFAEAIAQTIVDTAPNRILSFQPPAEVAGANAIRVAFEEGLITADTQVGLLGSNNASATASTERSKEVLDELGVSYTEVTVNTLQDDNAAINAEAAAAAATFASEGVQHVFIYLPFTNVAGFWTPAQEAGEFGFTLVDATASSCTAFGGSATPATTDGITCVTANDFASDGLGELATDSEFEAACRERWIETFPEDFEGSSDPGVPSGDILTTESGEMLYSDYAPTECTLANLLEEALTNAGVNPTRDDVYNAFLELSGPAAQSSNGQGAFGPDKWYFANEVQLVELHVVEPVDPTPGNKVYIDRGEDGTFDGCPAPVNCWYPVSGEWFPIEE